MTCPKKIGHVQAPILGLCPRRKQIVQPCWRLRPFAALSFLGYLRFKKPRVFSSCHSEKLTAYGFTYICLYELLAFVPDSFSPNCGKSLPGESSYNFWHLSLGSTTFWCFSRFGLFVTWEPSDLYQRLLSGFVCEATCENSGCTVLQIGSISHHFPLSTRLSSWFVYPVF